MYVMTNDSVGTRISEHDMQVMHLSLSHKAGNPLTHWVREYFPDDIFKCIILNENIWILIKILSFIPKVRINVIPALVQMIAWCLPGDKPFSESMMVTVYIVRDFTDNVLTIFSMVRHVFASHCLQYLRIIRFSYNADRMQTCVTVSAHIWIWTWDSYQCLISSMRFCMINFQNVAWS